MKRIKNSQNGITLVALVVTIVVLIILALISINAVLGENGIIFRTETAKIEHRGASVEEARDMWNQDQMIYQRTEGERAQSLYEILTELVNQNLITEEEKQFIIDNGYIDIGRRHIEFKEVEVSNNKDAFKLLINSGEDGIMYAPVALDSGCIIDWGDGNIQTAKGYRQSIKLASLNDGIKLAELSPGPSHEYAEKNKEYIITIKNATVIHSNYCQYGSTYKSKIIEVLQWGEGLKSINLSNCYNLRKIASPEKNSFEEITDFRISECSSLNRIPSDLFINCPNITSLEYAFSNCTGLTGEVIELWNLGDNSSLNNWKGTPNGYRCFYGCVNLTNYQNIPDYWKN